MRKFKKSWYLILVATATLALGAIAIVTAIRLYQIGEQPVAPTAPTSRPRAIETEEEEEERTPTQACTLNFNVQAAETSPSPSPTLSPSPSPSSSPSPSPSLSPSPTPSPRLSPSPSPRVELPEAGIALPTIIATLGGIILILIGLLL